MAFIVNDNILWLQISVDELMLMHYFQSDQHFCCVELGPFLLILLLAYLQIHFVLNDPEQVLARTIFGHIID